MGPYQKNKNIMVYISRHRGTCVAAFSSVGNYPLMYVTKKCDVLCASCVEDDLDECCDRDNDSFIVACDINWEDHNLTCCNCSCEIEAAYEFDSDRDDTLDAEVSAAISSRTSSLV